MARPKVHGHRLSSGPSPTYYSWFAMRQRCNNPNRPNYSYYGGRGIGVCSEWDSFQQFLEDMGERPDGMSLDRIDNEGHYTPENCRWATYSEQQRHNRKEARGRL